MKKHPIPLLILCTCIFTAFTLGLFLGRNCFRDDVILSAVPTVPSHNTPVSETTVPAQTEQEVSYPININTASEEELILLPGIGPELAERIIHHRTANGPYCTPEELLNVEGIGPGKLEAILDLITTGGNSQ